MKKNSLIRKLAKKIIWTNETFGFCLIKLDRKDDIILNGRVATDEYCRAKKVAEMVYDELMKVMKDE